MKKVGLIDVDGHNFPNLPLMKLSAWHKRKGDEVEWYEPFKGILEEYDIVYMSKVFSDEYTKDYEFPVYAKKVVKGGTGYAIKKETGIERYDAQKDKVLPDEIEHIYPDYSLYPDQTKDTAYGFLTRGCPYGYKIGKTDIKAHNYCHVSIKEGYCSRKVADLREFWNGQKNIVLCDPNILACQDHMELLEQLKESKARVDFNQGLDIRLVNSENIKLIKEVNLKSMDDFILIHESEEYLNTCREKIEAKLQDKGFAFNQKKTKVYSLRKGITFLGFTFKLTDTGKVILILKPKNVKQERKKLYRLVQQAKRGEKPKAKVDECYNGWRNHAAKGNSTKLLRRMDKYYKDLWKGEA